MPYTPQEAQRLISATTAVSDALMLARFIQELAEVIDAYKDKLVLPPAVDSALRNAVIFAEVVEKGNRDR